ncbi:hypothetical protein ACFL27_16515 [candidate division CSSED10-310 bacterium]|uniref:Outer membrane lipoprotein-sorting protein n=1 Tax=candidate division CSSED10-310 bacterium TaxID=2855610 RepID=A0ABV6Z027_UNCC1
MKLLKIIILFIVVSQTYCSDFVQSETLKREEIISHRKIFKYLIASGDNVSRVDYFTVRLKNNVSGFSKIEIKKSVSPEHVHVYEFQQDLFIKTPDGACITAKVSAFLDLQFTPLRITMKKEVITPENSRLGKIEHLILGKEEMKRIIVQHGQEHETQVALPEEPYCFAIEGFLQFLDLNKVSWFKLHELNPQNGIPVQFYFLIRQKAAGDRVVTRKNRDGTIKQVLVLDKENKLIRIEEQNLVQTNISEDQYNMLKKRF